LLTIGYVIDPLRYAVTLKRGKLLNTLHLGILMVWCHSGACTGHVLQHFSILLMPVLHLLWCHFRHALFVALYSWVTSNIAIRRNGPV
jgi:hypothetical protein